MAQLADGGIRLHVNKFLAYIAIALFTLSGCSEDKVAAPTGVQKAAEDVRNIATPAETTVVRVALAPFQDALLPSLGETKGWYKDEGLNVEFKLMAMSEMQEALAAGAVDVTFNNISSVISTHSKDPNAVFAYGFNIFDGGYAIMVRRDGGTKPLSAFLSKTKNREEAVKACAAQLKGKTIVTTSHTDMEQAVTTAVSRGGLNFINDVHIRDFNPDEGLAAFLSGTGDAYLGGIPQRTRAKKEGMIEMLAGPDLGSPEINGYVTTKQFAKDHTDALLKLLHVWFKSVNYVNANMDDGATIIVAKLNSQSGASFTNEDFKRFWNKIEHYPPTPESVQTDILDPNGYSYWRNRWNDCNHYFVDITKALPAKVDPDGIFIMPEIQAQYIKKYGKN